MPATKLDLTINRPITMRVKYADVYPGKLWPDPKDGGKEKQLPPSLKLTGAADGIGEVILYIPADFSSFLTNAGASAEQKKTKNGTPVTSYTLPATRRTWVVEKVQDAGDRHPRIEFYEPNANPLAEVPQALRGKPETMPWDGKPAVDQTPPDGAKQAPIAPQSPEPPSAIVGAAKHPLALLYGDCLQDVMELVRPYLDAEDPAVVFTGTDVAAMVATLFIGRSRNI